VSCGKEHGKQKPVKVTAFKLQHTESPSDNIRITFEGGSQFYTSTRLAGFDGYNCVRKLFPQLCQDSSEFAGPFDSTAAMEAAVVGTELTQEQYGELMEHSL
jgi:hypothetical protein